MAQFDGSTFDPIRDGPRLRGALERVRNIMVDGKWHTLRTLADKAQCSEAAVSARLRDLRKEKFGAYDIEARYWKDGVWLYRMMLGKRGIDEPQGSSQSTNGPPE